MLFLRLYKYSINIAGNCEERDGVLEQRILRYSMHIDFQMMKYHSSKMRVFLFAIKTVFPMFVRIAVRFVEVQMPDKGC